MSQRVRCTGHLWIGDIRKCDLSGASPTNATRLLSNLANINGVANHTGESISGESARKMSVVGRVTHAPN